MNPFDMKKMKNDCEQRSIDSINRDTELAKLYNEWCGFLSLCVIVGIIMIGVGLNQIGRLHARIEILEQRLNNQ